MAGGKRALDRTAKAGVYSLVVLAVLFLLIPIVVGIAMSFDARSFLGPFPPKQFSLRWYERFFADPIFMRALRVSTILAVVATVISTGLGVAAAVALDRYRFRGREAVLALFLSPLIVPAVVVGFALLLFFSQLGVYDGFTRLIGAHIIIIFPYTLRATLAGLVGINPRLTRSRAQLGRQ